MGAQEVVQMLETRGMKLAIAESLTGGLLTSNIVEIAGASKVLLGSVIAYQSTLKTTMLGVNASLLSSRGAVDPEVAIQMAEGIRSRLSLQLMIPTEEILGLATTGVAGPEEQDGKPAGTVFIAISGAKGVRVWEHGFSGSRNQIREQSVSSALEHIREYFSPA